MSKVKTNTIQHVDGSSDNITLDASQNVTCESGLTVDGTLTQTGGATFAGLNTFNNVSTDIYFYSLCSVLGIEITIIKS